MRASTVVNRERLRPPCPSSRQRCDPLHMTDGRIDASKVSPTTVRRLQRFQVEECRRGTVKRLVRVMRLARVITVEYVYYQAPILAPAFFGLCGASSPVPDAHAQFAEQLCQHRRCRPFSCKSTPRMDSCYSSLTYC